MKLCDTCIYRNNVEQLKPCIIYRDDCEYYEREEDMKAIIQIDVPNYQIGQEVSIYFKDTMMIKGIVQESSGDLISRAELLKAIDTWDKFGYTETGCFVREPKGDYVPYIHYDDVIKCIKGMPSVNPQEPKTGHWILWNTDSYDYTYKCDKCGSIRNNDTNYCPNCGCRMVEPQERSE